MRSFKVCGAAAIAAMALMASMGASNASATKLYGSGGELGVGTEIIASSEKTSTFSTLGGTTLVTCAGVGFGAGVGNAGGASATVSGAAAVAFAGCTKTVSVLSEGSFEIHYISGTTNGTLTASGFEVTVNTIFGSCTYGPGASNDLGALAGGTPATITINTIVPKLSGNFACPAEARWTATYSVTSPSPLNVEAS